MLLTVTPPVSAQILRSMGLVFLAVSLAACSPSKDYGDIDNFMADVDARPKERIEPLPPIKTIPPYAYKASSLRSPFEPPVVVKPIDPKEGPRVVPDFNRVKQFLEQYSIGQLSMVGTLQQQNTMFALIQDGDGGVHRVQEGDYMGTDHGAIQAVTDGEIELVEIVPDGTGGWVERARTVNLAGGA